MKKQRIILYQKPPGIPVSHKDAREMQKYRPHFVCFPEYFYVNKKLGNQVQTPHNQKRQQQRISVLSQHLDSVIVGGTMPELSNGLLYNTSFVYDRGKPVGFYRKRRLFFIENGLMTPGNSYKVFRSENITFGILICADVFEDISFLEMKKLGAQIIFIPTFSPRKEETVEDKFKRDEEIFVRGAGLSEALIVKVCSVPSPYKNYVHGRSLIASPDGIIYRVKPENEDTALIIKKEVSL